MSLPSRIFSLLLALVVIVGCDQKAPVGDGSVPAAAGDGSGPAVVPATGDGSAALEILDLRPYGIRGEIVVPRGSKVFSRDSDCEISSGKAFNLIIALGDTPNARVKEDWQAKTITIVNDESAMLIGLKDDLYELFARVELGGMTFVVRSPLAPLTREELDRLVASVRTLRPSSSNGEAAVRETVARERLAKAGFDVRGANMKSGVVLTGLAVTDAVLRDLGEISGFGELTVVDAPNVTVAGWTSVAALRGMEQLTVSGPTPIDLSPFATAKSPLRSLNLSRSRVTDLDLAHIRELPDLQSLDLADTAITDDGVQRLEGHVKLATLRLSRTRIRGGCLTALSDIPSLKSLDLSDTLVGDAGVDKLRGSALKLIFLTRTGVSDSGVKTLASLAELKTISMGGTRVTDVGVKLLAGVKTLERIDLSYCKVGDAVLTDLQKAPILKSLTLADTAITDKAMAVLATFPMLEQLSLIDCDISDVGLASFASATAPLSFIDLRYTRVTMAGLDRLAKAKPMLDIGRSTVALEPDPKPIAPAIGQLPPADPTALFSKFNAKLVHEDNAADKPIVGVTFRDSTISDLDLANLRDLKTLESLKLIGCGKVTDVGLAYLAGLTDLRELTLTGTGVKGDGLVLLKGLTRLTVLELPNVPVTLKQLRPVSGSKGLERLKVTVPDSDEALAFFAAFAYLKELDLRGVRINNRRTAYLKGMAALEKLDLRSDALGDRGLENLKGLKTLKDLTLKTGLATDAGLNNLAGLAGLKALDIEGARFTDAGFAFLRDKAELERLRVTGTGLTDRGLLYFRDLGKLIELDLKKADISDKGLQSIADLKDLEFIDLNGTKVTDAGLKHFKGMNELRTLTLEDTAITGKGFAELRKLERLSRLHLARTAVNDEGLMAIAGVAAIEHLDLDGTPVTDIGLAKLGMLPTLQRLSLNGVKGLTEKVAAILIRYPQLTEVSLRGTGLPAKAIAELKRKEGLTVVAD